MEKRFIRNTNYTITQDGRVFSPFGKVINKSTGEIFLFKSIREAVSLNLNRKNITAILKNKKSNTYDYEFYYI